MSERCQASDNGRTQCRIRKNLMSVLVSLDREPHFRDKLCEQAIIRLCPRHLKLNVLERLALRDVFQARFDKILVVQDGAAESKERG